MKKKVGEKKIFLMESDRFAGNTHTHMVFKKWPNCFPLEKYHEHFELPFGYVIELEKRCSQSCNKGSAISRNNNTTATYYMRLQK